MARSFLPFKPTIARPCEESWAAMEGGARERHCGLCDKQVHNFAAMTSREIERVVREKQGQLCARITRRGDGSLVTLDGVPRASLAAQMAASAALVVGAAGVAAQSTGEHSVARQNVAAKCEKTSAESSHMTTLGTLNVTADPAMESERETLSLQIGDNEEPAVGQAILTGTVLKPDGSGPVAGALISLRTSSEVAASVKADDAGNFRIVAQPGSYDVVVRQNVLFGTRVFAVNLHKGEQSLQAVKTHFYYVHDDGSPYEITTTMGEISGTISYTFSGAVHHPWSYLKYLVRKL